MQVAVNYSGYSLQHLQRLLRNSKIEGIKSGRFWLIDKGALDTYLKQAQDATDQCLGRNSFFVSNKVFTNVNAISLCLCTPLKKGAKYERMILDAGNSIIKTKIENGEFAFPHAIQPLTKGKYQKTTSRASINRDSADYIRVNEKPYGQEKALSVMGYLFND